MNTRQTGAHVADPPGRIIDDTRRCGYLVQPQQAFGLSEPEFCRDMLQPIRLGPGRYRIKRYVNARPAAGHVIEPAFEGALSEHIVVFEVKGRVAGLGEELIGPTSVAPKCRDMPLLQKTDTGERMIKLSADDKRSAKQIVCLVEFAGA